MTNPTCHNCGDEIQLLLNENGKWEPFDFVFRSHWASCKKRKKVEDSLAVLAMVGLGIKVTEARGLVKGLKGDDETVLAAALKRRDEERRTV